MGVSAQAQLKNSENVPFIVRAYGSDKATAEAHLQKKLLLINGTVVKVTESEQQDEETFPPAGAGAGTSFDLKLQIGTDTSTARTETIVNGKPGLSLANSPGVIDVTKAEIAAYAAAYRDASGTGGYSAVSGQYHKS